MDAQTLLQRAGWFPGRRIDVADDLEFVKSEGFTVTPAAERFLQEYSGLVIDWETNRNPIVISGREVARGVDAGWCDAYSKAIGVVLSPVGEYSHMSIYIDPAGALWGGSDSEYGLLGSLMDLIRGTFLEPPTPFDRHLALD